LFGYFRSGAAQENDKKPAIEQDRMSARNKKYMAIEIQYTLPLGVI